MTTAILCLFEDILFYSVVEAKHYILFLFFPASTHLSLSYIFPVGADGIRR